MCSRQIFAFLAAVGFSVLALNAAPPAPTHVEGQALIRFKPDATLETARACAQDHSCELIRHFAWLSEQQGRVCGLVHSLDKSTSALVTEFSADPLVELAEPDFLRYTSAMRPPNDTLFPQMWALRNIGQSVNGFSGQAQADIRFLDAYGMARPIVSDAVVAVIDTGVDTAHPDLAANIFTNTTEIPGNGVDDDGNGYTDDVHGYDFADADADPSDASEHGTHVSGTIAATGANQTGVIGVAFRARVLPLKASSDGDSLPDSAILEALQYCAMMKQRGTNIVSINASFGGGGFSTLEHDAIETAGNLGIIFCAAAGNSGGDNDVDLSYPASYRLSNMLVVAATSQSDALAGFSNYGATTVDLAAPGVNIVSSVPRWVGGTIAQVQSGATTYSANPLVYAGQTAGITASIHDCGIGNPGDFPPDVSGNIALIERGTLYFSEKVSNAMNAGAVAAIIYNNAAGNFSGTLQTAGGWIPAISISQADGQALLASLPANGVVINAPDPSQAYLLLNGTSMSTPHVSGAVAFAAQNFPNESMTARRQRILGGVTPLASLSGKVVTGGRLNLARIVDSDGNGLPDWWEQTYFGSATGNNPSADPDHDGQNNLAEWLAGTNPNDATSVLRFSAIKRAASNKVTLQWPSFESRYYRLLGSGNPNGLFNEIVKTNILATPPLNAETLSVPAGAKFLRLQIEP